MASEKTKAAAGPDDDYTLPHAANEGSRTDDKAAPAEERVPGNVKDEAAASPAAVAVAENTPSAADAKKADKEAADAAAAAQKAADKEYAEQRELSSSEPKHKDADAASTGQSTQAMKDASGTTDTWEGECPNCGSKFGNEFKGEAHLKPASINVTDQHYVCSACGARQEVA